jgi:hypothetical protein
MAVTTLRESLSQMTSSANFRTAKAAAESPTTESGIAPGQSRTLRNGRHAHRGLVQGTLLHRSSR